jgi:Pyruvate/2-oxoacid:ferredoxin oxidoreductase delta subunit
MRGRLYLPGRKSSPIVNLHSKRMNMKPRLMSRRCPVQRDLCTAIKVCTTGAIYYLEDENEPLGGRILFDYEKCNECGRCAVECCGHAIEMVEV